ncbi:unnamed protein product [Phaeothamnion confervicola]
MWMIHRATSNDELVTQLEERGILRKEVLINAFKAVDRADFLPTPCKPDAYCDQPLKHEKCHHSAPHMYATALDALDLHPGLSFLNIGSGTGYFNSVVAAVTGADAINHGVEIHADVLEHARRCNIAHVRRWLASRTAEQGGHAPAAAGSAASATAGAAIFGGGAVASNGNGRFGGGTNNEFPKSSAMAATNDGGGNGALAVAPAHGGAVGAAAGLLAADEAAVRTAGSVAGCPFSDITFVCGNVFQLDPEHSRRYARIYVGAECPPRRRDALCKLLDPHGGVLVGPFGEEFLKIRRDGEEEFRHECIAVVRFAPLLASPPLPCVLPKTVWSPSCHNGYPPSFRIVVHTVLLCAARGGGAPAASLPRPLWLVVLSYADRDWFVAGPAALARMAAQLAAETAAR